MTATLTRNERLPDPIMLSSSAPSAAPDYAIEVRHLRADLRNNTAAFLIADERALIYRLQASSWDGIAEMNDPPVARRYLAYFEDVWQASEPHRELRQIRM